MSSYREESNEAKAVRRGIVDARPVNRASKKRGAKAVVVEIRYPGLKTLRLNGWHKFGAYPDRETADKVIADKERSNQRGIEYRIKP